MSDDFPGGSYVKDGLTKFKYFPQGYPEGTVPGGWGDPLTWEQAVDRVLSEMRTIMVERQNKYGKANIRDQGLHGVITRGAADKMARIKGALNGSVVGGKVVLNPIEDGTDAADTFEDGLLDAANYFGPIALMVHRNWWELPRENPADER